MGDDASWLPDARPRREPVTEISDGWQSRLLDKGAKRGLANCAIALRHAPCWNGVVAFDEFASSAVFLKPPPWDQIGPFPRKITEIDDIRGCEWAQVAGIVSATPATWAQALEAHARNSCFHPVRDFLRALEWDSDRRIDTWLSTYLGATPGDYVAAIGACWLISGVARAFKPGCKADSILVLEGPQGSKKSTALRTLAEPWFSDDLSDLGSKDSQLGVRGAWLIELSELDALSRVDVSKMKAFLSRATDRYRPPYGRRLLELPRESIFAASTNNDDYLRDQSGGRRFWCVRCGFINVELLARDRLQLWAEAVARFEEGSKWWLENDSLVAAAKIEQADRYEGNVWDDLIEDWIKSRESVSITEILGGCLVKPAANWTQADRNNVGRVLRSLGWERYNSGPRGARKWRWRPGEAACSRVSSQAPVNTTANTGLFG